MLTTMIDLLPYISQYHHHNSQPYQIIYRGLKEYISNQYHNSYSCHTFNIGLDEIYIPYYEMGHISSINLFDLDEIILFSFYKKNRQRYKNVLDIGANIGLHSIIMDKCGFNVWSFEPDPKHFQQLIYNIKLNKCINIMPHRNAVSDKETTVDFVRVLDNTTANHIIGDKDTYGPTETIQIETKDINQILQERLADLIKIDTEGHENIILHHMNDKYLDSCDIILEVNNKQNAQFIFDSFFNSAYLLSQKTGWKQVNRLIDMPTSYKEGSLFISRRFKTFYEN